MEKSSNELRVEPTAETAQGATFGAYAINFRAQLLHKHGIRLRISPQTLRVLICLVEQSPKLVEREHLFQLLWPSDTHVDFTGNLNAIIRDLRVLLGDSARNPRYIETEPRRGYRFIAPVGWIPDRAGPLPVSLQSEPIVLHQLQQTPAAVPQLGHPRPAWLFAIGLVLFLSGGVFGLWQWWHNRAPAPPAAVPHVTQLTSFSGQAGHATLSPDGRRVAFHWDGNASGNFDIYVATFGSEKLQRLTHGEADDLYPAWSPDGRDIAFLRRYPGGRCAIFLIPALGASDASGERWIRDVPTESTLSWSPDGGWLAYTVLYWAAPQVSSPDFGVYAVSLLTGQVVRLTSPPKSAIGDEDGAFSPDGEKLAFFRSSSMGVSELYVQDLDSSKHPQGPAKQITFERQNSRNPAWTPDGSKIVFSSLKGGVRSLWEVDLGSEAAPVQIGGENAQQPVFDPSGKRIIYERINVSDTLQVLPLCGVAACPETQPRRLPYSRDVARNPSWSPDGQRIAFEASEHGNVQVWRCDRDGSNAVVLSSFDAPLNGTPRWSPDGTQLAMDSRISGHGHIFLVNATTGAVKQLTAGDWEDVTASFSHDGQAIYFASNRTGTFQVWKMSLATGATTQVTKRGGFYAVESLDGKDLYYAKGIERTEIGRVPVNGGEEQTAIASLSYWLDFTAAPQGIYYAPARSKGEEGVPISFYRFSDGKSVPVATVPGVDLQGIAWAPDGRELLISLRTSSETNLMGMSFAEKSP